MAITSYIGRPGAGKSYEVVSNVLLPALENGRRIVTNIDGLKIDLIKEYLFNEKKIDYVDQGIIVICTRDQITSKGFFCLDQHIDVFNEPIVKPGDLVIIDEAQNFYSYRHRLTEEQCRFFREHRHFVSDTGICCDLVLIHQRFQDLHSFLRGVVELTFEMHQKKAMGLPNHYSATCYDGDPRDGNKIRAEFHKYHQKIHSFYASTALPGGKQAVVDKRQNALGLRFWATAVALLAVMFFCGAHVWNFFHPEDSKPKTKPAMVASSSAAVSPGVTSFVRKSVFSSKFRILGSVTNQGKKWVVVQDAQGLFRFENGQNFKGQGSLMVGEVEGEKVTYFSGNFEVDDKKKKGF